jgi:hypothetical protein
MLQPRSRPLFFHAPRQKRDGRRDAHANEQDIYDTTLPAAVPPQRGNSTGPRRLFRAAVPDHFRPMTSGETPRLKNGNKPSKNTRQAPFFSIPTVIYSVAVVI